MIERFLQNLAFRSRGRTAESMKRQDATAQVLRVLLSHCPVCRGELSRHRFAEIASTTASESNRSRVTELIGHVRQHRWEELTDYKDFRGDQNALVVYAILGPHEQGAVILVRDPVELYENDEIYLQEQLNQNELSVFNSLVPKNHWREFL
jgi:hypothetical protein